MSEERQYAEAWKDLRRRNWAFGLAVALLVIVAIGRGYVTTDFGWRWVAFIATFGLCVFALKRRDAFRCPRCFEPFRARLSWRSLRKPSGQCQHCGLDKGAARDPGDAWFR